MLIDVDGEEEMLNYRIIRCNGVKLVASERRNSQDSHVIRDLVEQLVLILLLLLSIQIIALFINDYCYFVSCLCTGTYTACHDTAMLHKNVFPLFFSHII